MAKLASCVGDVLFPECEKPDRVATVVRCASAWSSASPKKPSSSSARSTSTSSDVPRRGRAARSLRNSDDSSTDRIGAGRSGESAAAGAGPSVESTRKRFSRAPAPAAGGASKDAVRTAPRARGSHVVRRRQRQRRDVRREPRRHGHRADDGARAGRPAGSTRRRATRGRGCAGRRARRWRWAASGSRAGRRSRSCFFGALGFSVLCLACCLGASFSSPEAPRGGFLLGLASCSLAALWLGEGCGSSHRQASWVCLFLGVFSGNQRELQGPRGRATGRATLHCNCSTSSGFYRFIAKGLLSAVRARAAREKGSIRTLRALT